MKITLRLTKNGVTLHAGRYEIVDADSFGKACADAWGTLRQAQLEKETSIGALMEHLNMDVVDQLNGAVIKLDPS
jgi:hypothetical protein